MASALLAILGDGVNLPHDFIPDGNYSDDCEDEYSGESLQKTMRCHGELILSYYNNKHLTNYNKIKEYPRGMSVYHDKSEGVHYGFSAVDEATGEVKHLWAVLKLKDLHDRDGVVSFCCTVEDGLQTIGCERCQSRIEMQQFNPNWNDQVIEFERQRMEQKCEMASMMQESLLKYANYLQDGAIWTEKNISRFEVCVPAMTYYNKKHHKDYKLVDALPIYSKLCDVEPSCSKPCTIHEFFTMTHCNFIARQNAPGEDVSNKLFFAELVEEKGRLVVSACRILHGCKTTAGCHYCTSKIGRRVVHPTHGFRHGLHPPAHKSLRHGSR